MTEPPAQERALRAIRDDLERRNRRYALAGGLAVSIRAEPRFTRGVDVVVDVADDTDAEGLVHELKAAGYRPIATVEHEAKQRLSTVRLASPSSVVVDLLFASSGIEGEAVARATVIDVPAIGSLRVVRSAELLAMKILSMRERRLQDRIDALKLLEIGEVDLSEVRANLALITARGFDRGQDLAAKLDALLAVPDEG